MINVSNELSIKMNKRTNFYGIAEITFLDGSFLTLEKGDFTLGNCSVVDSSDVNGVPVGVAVCRHIQIELINDMDQYSEYDFYGARIRLYLTYQLSDSVEKIEYGTFTVLTPETYGTTIVITTLDDMYKADADYTTKLVFPTTIGSMFRDACDSINVQPGTTSFKNDDFMVQMAPSDITFRQVFGYIAMIAGGNVRIDTTGRMRIITYDFSILDKARNLVDGGTFMPWTNPCDYDGGAFNPWDEGDILDGGDFLHNNDYHILYNWSNLKIDTDDITITGVQTVFTDDDNQKHTFLYGSDGYVIDLPENPLWSGKHREAIDLIGPILVGARFRQFSGDLVSNPTCEFMDMAVIIDRKSNQYYTFLTNINYQILGYTSLSNSAEPVIRNNSKSYSPSESTLQTARKLIKKERTAREQAVEQLAKDLANSSGLYITEDQQPDKSVIYYMHDKPTLEDSMIVWKLTALAFGISTDGGKTYPYGFTVDGEVVTRLLYAEGIDADYIDAGAIRIADADGKELFYASYDNKEVRINAESVLIGSEKLTENLGEMSTQITANSDGITAEVKRAQGQEVELAASIKVVSDNILLKVSKGEVSSQLSVESGEININSDRFAWNSTNSSLTHDGKLTAKEVDISGKISADNGKIGGFYIEKNCITSSQSGKFEGMGVYVGEEGISVSDGFNGFSVKKSDGTVKIIGYESSISFGKDTDTYGNVTITRNKIKVGKMTLNTDATGSHFNSDSPNLNIDGLSQISMSLNGAQKHVNITNGLLTLGYDADSQIKIDGTSIKIGGRSLSFFGHTAKIQQTVSEVSTASSVTVSDVAKALNNLINALSEYGLIKK